VTERIIRQAWSPNPSVSKLEKRYLHKKGKVVWGEVHTRLFCGPQSGTAYTMAQVIDITERKEAEETSRQREQAYKALADNAPDVVVRFDRKFRHLYVSPAIESISTRPARDYIGKTNKELGVPPHLDRLWCRAFRAVFRTGQTQAVEFELHTPLGLRAYQCRIAPEFDSNGSVQHLVAITRDITDQKQLKDDLHKSHAELERKVEDRTNRLRSLAGELTRIEQRERRRITHILHEDLQQVLVAIKFQLSEVPRITPDTQEKNADDQERVMDMIDTALSITRNLCVGLTPSVLHDLGLNAALEWLADDMRKTAGVTVIVNAPHPFHLKSDDIRAFAFTAIREILMNVVKHAQVKAASIRVRTIRDNQIRIEIRDKGVGFDPHLDTGRSFGLFSIRERAAALGCHLDLSSAPGRGTCVILTVPIAE
jgi:PAS domain S-box-containing protein